MKNKILAMLLSFTLIFTTTGFSFADDEVTPVSKSEKQIEQVVEKKAEAPVAEKKVDTEKKVIVKEEAPKVEAAPAEEAVKQEEPKELDSVDEPKEVANAPPAKLDEKAKVKEDKAEKKPPKWDEFEAIDWEGYYDGQPHSISVNPSTPPFSGMHYEYQGPTGPWTRTMPTFTEVGTYKVKVKISSSEIAHSPVREAYVIIKEPEPEPPVVDPIKVTWWILYYERTYEYNGTEYSCACSHGGLSEFCNSADYKTYIEPLIHQYAPKGTDVGNYRSELTPEILANAWAASGNTKYDVTFEVRSQGSLTITPRKATVNVDVDKVSVVYDGQPHDYYLGIQGTHHFKIDDEVLLKFCDPETLAYKIKVQQTNKVNVGKYPIKLSSDPKDYTFSADVLKNFELEIIVDQGYLEITPAVYTLKINDATKVYGESDPKFTADWNGPFKIKYSLYRDEGEDVGKYKIKAKIGFEAKPIDAVAKKKVVLEEKVSIEKEKIDTEIKKVDNYKIEVIEGTFTITPREAIIIANDKSKMLGEATPKFDARVVGVLPGDEDQIPEYTLDCEWVEAVGDYPIIVTIKGKDFKPIEFKPIEKPELEQHLEEAVMEYAKEEYAKDEVLYAKAVEMKKVPAEAISDVIHHEFEIIPGIIFIKESNYKFKTQDGVFKIRDKETPPTPPVDPDTPDNPVVGPTDNGDNTPGLGDGDSTVMKAKANGVVKTGDADACWALLNLLLMLTSCLIAFMIVLSRVLKRDKEYVDEPKSFFNNWFESIISVVVAVFTAIVFFITENMNTLMVWTDRWTIMMIVLFVLQLAVAVYAKFKDKIFKEDN